LAGPLVGVVEDPENSVCWEDVKRHLEPAAGRNGIPLLEQHDLVWIVAHDGKLKGAATTRLSSEGYAEVVLVGGRDHRLWLKQLDQKIGEWATSEGCHTLAACGRKGWRRSLGWDVLGEHAGNVIYGRKL